MFADLGVYMLKIEGFVCISYLDYPGAKSYAYSGYDTLEYKTADSKSGISAAIKHSEKAMGHPSLLSKEAGRYNGRRNADKLIPGEVLPPCVETESRFLIKNGVLMQYLGHEEEITIPDTCTSIGVRAFKDQTQLRRVSVPKSVKGIGESAFEGCTALEQIELTKGLKKIGRDAFSKTALTHIDLPDGLTGMEWSALSVSLRIPASLKKIDKNILSSLAWAEVAPKNPCLRLPQRGDLPPGGCSAAESALERKRGVRDSRECQKSGG